MTGEVRLRLRRYEPEDAEATLRICRRAISQTAATDYSRGQIEVWLPERDPGGWHRRIRGSEASGAEAYVAELSGQIAGFGTLLPEPETCRIDLLYVDPDFARQGVATALIHHLLARSRAVGASACTIEASNTLRPLLERLGFTLIRTQRISRSGVELENHLMRTNNLPIGSP